MEYEKLLDRLYEKLPKKTVSGERFEPPSFISFIHGKQTVIKNFNEVANSLRRKPNHLLKYIVKELASPGNFDGRRALLQGNFRNDLLNKRLEGYIKEYVLCNECKKPDTEFVTLGGVKHKRCEVCGARAPVKAIK